MMESASVFGLAIVCIWLYVFGEPAKQGFWTKDPSIRFPLLPLTVSLTTVLIISLLCPTVVMIVTEKLVYRRSPSAVCKKFALMTLVNITVLLYFKYSVGRLRPHFLSACKPNVDLTGDNYYFGTDYVCNPVTHFDEWNGRQSFFSGHASLAFGAAVFLALYVHSSFRASFLKSICQVFTLLVGFYPGITQGQNYWHHWSDVATGYAAGSVIAIAAYYTLPG
jgi:phosphatidate phosphatase